jgi:hypothetical protein
MADAFDDQAEDPFAEYFEDPESEDYPVGPGIQLNPVGCLFNILSGILVAATLVVGLVFAAIFINPQSSLNPLPPTTMPVLHLTYTPSPTPRPVLPPTWTPIFPPVQEPTLANQPTETPIPTNTPIPTADLESGTTFRLQEGSPKYETNTYHPEAGCNWLGVGGEILDAAGEPVLGVLIEARGSLGGVDIYRLTLSGTATNYGQAGYELPLYDSPIESTGEVWIQVLDQANLPLSDKIYLLTYDSCDSNLIRINFVQNTN